MSTWEACQNAVSKIIDDLSDRRGLKQEWDQIDDETKKGILEKWTEIIYEQLL